MIKIKKIKFYNHNIFGNHEFDFTGPNGEIANNIIIAGENGIGKTKLLEEFYNISNKTFYLASGEHLEKTHEIFLDISSENYLAGMAPLKLNKVDEAVLTISKNRDGNEIYNIKFESNKYVNVNITKDGNKITRFKMKCLYSNVNINYKPLNIINGITNKTLDSDFSEETYDIASEIIQLLSDVTAQDMFDSYSYEESNINENNIREISHNRISRFTDAFQLMFGDEIRYKGIRKNSIPMFEKEGKELEITELSSGEKQIIFRGVQLLKNKNSFKGANVFIDEPELSMHPKWEVNIYKYYKKLFFEGGNQTSQMFIATHSEHIIESALAEEDAVIIKISKDNIEKYYNGSNSKILPIISNAELKYSIFDLYTIEFHTLLYGFIQQNYIRDKKGRLIDEPNLIQTDNWLKMQNVPLKKYIKKFSTKKPKEYETLSTYIRNCINHPDVEHNYTHEELVESIESMIFVIQNVKIF